MATSSTNSGKKKLFVALLNINGLRNKTDDIRHIIGRDKVHVLALCETKLDPSVKDSKVYIPGFRMWRKDRDSKGGGVALYIQDHIETTSRSDLMKTRVEIIWVEMTIPGSRPVLLGCCYRPPNNNVDYLVKIYEMMTLVSKEKEDKDILLMGDFNINWTLDSLLRNIAVHVSSKWELEQIVIDPTRVTKDSATCIDHIYTNVPELCSEPKSTVTGCSDHNLITAKVEKHIPEKVIRHRSNKEFNRERYIRDVKKAQWTEVYEGSDPLSTFTETFLSIVDKHSRLEIRSIYDLLKVDNELGSFMTTRDKAKMEKKENTKEYEKKVSNKIMDKQKKLLQPQVEAAKNDPEKLLKTFKKFLGESFPPYVINLTPEGDDPNHLNQTNTNTGECVPDGHQVQNSLIRRRSFSFRKIDAETVKRLLVYFCDHVTRGIDKFELELLKLAADDISGPICHILNTCINSKEFPSELKNPNTIQFPGTRHTFFRENSRNHGVHSVLGLILDAVLSCQTRQYFTDNELIASATREHEINRIQADWLAAAGSGKIVRVMFLDFSSLFHTISHDLIMNELRAKDLSGSALSLIKSYLSYHNGSCGLPQGGLLARLLFTIFLNDLTSVLKQSSASLSENHLMIYFAEDSHERLEDGKQSVLDWAEKKKICLNKTILTTTKEIATLEYIFKLLWSVLHCNPFKLNWIQGLKVIIQYHDFSWKNEFDIILKKLESYFGKKCLDAIPKEVKDNVINSLVHFQLGSTPLP